MSTKLPVSTKELVDAVRYTAEQLRKSPLEVTKNEVVALNPNVTKYALTRDEPYRDLLNRAVAGSEKRQTTVIKSPVRPLVTQTPQEVYEASTYNRRMRALRLREGQLASVGEAIRSSILEAFKATPGYILPKQPYKPRIKGAPKYEMLSVISDTHFGLDCKSFELPSNPYNWTKASRRMARLAETIVEFHPEHRSQTKQLRVCVAGDICQGAIHLDDHGQNLIGPQLYGGSHILSHFFDFILAHSNLDSIVVEYTSDNHMRRPHKGPGRGTAQKWDSYAYDLIYMLAQRYVNNPRIQFVPNMTPYSQFGIFGHKYLMTHGDTFFTPGNVGGKIDTQRLIHQFNRLRVQSQYFGTNVLITGHVHTQALITPSRKTYILVNGTGSGADLYAQSIGFEDTNIVQTLTEVSEKHAIGDYRMVELLEADDEPRYNNIIPVPPTGPDLLLPPTIIHRKA